MVFKTIISFICLLYRFYPVLPVGKTDCLPSFTQFYPTGFTHWVKCTMPSLYAITVKFRMRSAYMTPLVDDEIFSSCAHGASNFMTRLSHHAPRTG